MRHLSRISIMAIATAVVATAIVAGCAGTPLRTEETTSGIRAAEEVGAENVPRAALHLQLAKEEFENAKKLAASGDKEQASSLLQRSVVDAEMAIALSRENTEKSEAQAALDRAIQLRQDNK